MSVESRLRALEDFCNHSLANAKLLATDRITKEELARDSLERDYIGCDDDGDTMDVEELAQENAQLREQLDEALRLVGIMSLEITRDVRF